jgi:Icc protein
MNPVVRFVHITDTHIGPTRDFKLFDLPTLPAVDHIVHVINTLPVLPDFVVHTGDIVASPDPDAFRLAAETFSRLRVPIYYVSGNHDSSAGINRFLLRGRSTPLSTDENVNSYVFDVQGFRFAALDARGPDAIDPHGVLTEAQLTVMRDLVQVPGPPLVLFIHFPPLPLDSLWFDRDMLLLNGTQFHDIIRTARERIRGVFYGHVHRGIHIYADGVLYSSAPSVFCQFTAWPEEQSAHFDRGHPLRSMS